MPATEPPVFFAHAYKNNARLEWTPHTDSDFTLERPRFVDPFVGAVLLPRCRRGLDVGVQGSEDWRFCYSGTVSDKEQSLSPFFSFL